MKTYFLSDTTNTKRKKILVYGNNRYDLDTGALSYGFLKETHY